MASFGIQGTGCHTYELVGQWPTMPAGLRFGYTHGVAVDAVDNVYIFNQSVHAMCVFDRAGNFIRSWNCGFESGAHGLTYHRDAGGEFLYLCDYELPRICKTTLSGEIIWSLDSPPPGLETFYTDKSKYRPTNVAVAPNGDFYIADGYGENFIHQYDSDARHIRSFGGGRSDAFGKLNGPHGIIVDRRGPQPILLVADRRNVRIHSFGLEGEPLATFGKEHLRFPCHFDIRGTDLLIPDLHGRVTILDGENRLVTHLGDNPGVNQRQGYPNLRMEDWVPGQFISPHSACWDSHGDLYVVEWIQTGRVTKFRNIAVQ
jgi:DNA-binding beta-propeller fold protein YncE